MCNVRVWELDRLTLEEQEWAQACVAREQGVQTKAIRKLKLNVVN